MAKFTAAQIQEHAQRILDRFEDGLQWGDILSIIPEALDIVKSVSEMTDVEREESAVAIVDYVVDNTDTPWLPDNLIDPIIKKGARVLIPILNKKL